MGISASTLLGSLAAFVFCSVIVQYNLSIYCWGNAKACHLLCRKNSSCTIILKCFVHANYILAYKTQKGKRNMYILFKK